MNQTIEFNVQDLKPALIGLGKVIPHRNPLPVLGCVHIAPAPGATQAVLTATDLDTWLQVSVPVQSAGRPGETSGKPFLVPLTDLREAVKCCRPADVLRLQPETDADTDAGDRVSIARPVGGVEATETVESCPAADFPETPSVGGGRIELNASLKSSLLHAWETSSNDDTRYVLQGACLDVSDPKAHHIVGTDGRHLFSSNGANLPIRQSAIIPTRKVFGWKTIRDTEGWSMMIEHSNNDDDNHDGAGFVRFAGDDWAVITKLIDGNYPNWRQVIPGKGDYRTTIELPPEPGALAALAETVQKLPGAKHSHRPVGLQVSGNNRGPALALALIGSNGESEPAIEVPVPEARVTGPLVTTFINRDYFARALRFGLNRVRIIDALSPVQFRSEDEGRQMIIMPVRISAPATTTKATATPAKNESDTKPTTQTKTKERKTDTMVNTKTNSNGSNGSGSGPAAGADDSKSPIDTALEQIGEVKDLFKDAAAGLNGVTHTLKQAKADHRSTEREIRNVRSTIRSLQKVEL